MLKLPNTTPLEDLRYEVDIDLYVPLTIRLPRAEGDSTLYWRGNSDDGGLVEIGFRPDTGVLVSLVLVSVGEATDGPLATSLLARERIKLGLPRVDRNNWPIDWAKEFGGEYGARFLDDATQVNLILGSDSVLLTFSRDPQVSDLVGDGRVAFGLSGEGALECVVVRGLSPYDLQLLRTASRAS